MINKLKNLKIEENQLGIVWLGQAGFLIKTWNDKIITVDPYLTHCGERMKNFIRISPILIKPEDFYSDYYITTHKHFDHFDYDLIPIVSKKHNVKFLGPISCIEEFKKIDIGDSEIIELVENQVYENDKLIFKPVYADHGTLEPDALGIYMLLGCIKLYFTGDTAYRPENMKEIEGENIDIMFASINGEFGNLTSEEGAKLANHTNSKHIVPCHFWTFMEHKGNPWTLREEVEKYSPSTQTNYLTAGEIYIYEKGEENESSKIYRAF